MKRGSLTKQKPLRERKESLAERLRFERLLAEISTRLINLPVDQIESSIEDAQRRICELLDLDRSSLFMIPEEDSGALLLTHYYHPSGSRMPPASMNCREFFPWTSRKVLDGDTVIISKLADLPPEAGRDLESFCTFGTQSVVVVPLTVGEGPALGLLTFAVMCEERRWSEMAVMGFQLIAQVFANAFARQRSELALRESEERLSLAADSAGAGLWSLDLASGCYWLTDKAREQFEFEAEGVVTLDRVLAAIHPEDRDRVRQAVATVVESGKDGQVEYRVVKPDGTVRWLHSWGRVRYSPAGVKQRLTGVTMDITERKRLEMDAQRLRQELAHISRVATLGELVSSLAHELNQPLTAIQSNAQAAQRLLASGAADLAEIQEILTDIVADDQRASEVIRRVRSLLKKEVIGDEPFDLNEVITEVLGFLHRDAVIRGVTVTAKLSPGRLPMVGDRIQLQQVLVNLIVNAFDAMKTVPAAERLLTVQSQRSEANGVQVAVEDTGGGIPPDCQARLFEPFFTTKADGLGMGLPICRSIIAAHCGRIWAESNRTRGSRFCFELPMAGRMEGAPMAGDGREAAKSWQSMG